MLRNQRVDILYKLYETEDIKNISYVAESYENINTKNITIKEKDFKKYATQSLSIKRSYNKFVGNYDGEIIIDTDKDKLIGCVFVGNKKDKGFIVNLWVSNEYRKHGFGTKLLRIAINKYKGYDLTVSKNNKVAVNLYKKHGFVIKDNDVSENNGYYYMILKSKLNRVSK